MSRSRRVLVEEVSAERGARRPDALVVEEPLEIRLDGHVVATTMRTPGHDVELAVGWCHNDGLFDGAPVRRVTATGPGPGPHPVVDVSTGGRAPVPEARLGVVSSSCGACGSTSLAALRERLRPVVVRHGLPLDVLVRSPELMRPHQTLFADTGAVHAAALIDADGGVRCVREDIGRHNAVDKVVGRSLLDGELPAEGLGLVVSGRASFEIVQKAWAAGVAALVAVSAPSALAVEAAAVAGITLVGFARTDRAVLYVPGAVVR